MIVKIISIGTEILLGDITNTNAQYLAQKIAELGFSSYFQTVVGDNAIRLKTTIENSLEHSDIIIMTGGLGPTYDDVSKEIIADVMNLELILNKEVLHGIQTYFNVKNETMPQSNTKQAMIPAGATILDNSRGTAPGVIIEKDQKIIILLPGPPHEMKKMFEDKVQPYLAQLSDSKIVSSHLYLFGIGESELERQLQDKMKKHTNPTIAPYASDNVIMIRLTAKANTKKEAQNIINPVLKRIAKQFDPYVYSIDEANIEAVVVNKLIKNNLSIATAESCTGGMLSEMITRIPGVSKVYDLSMITYSNQSKAELLNVKKKTLIKYGAVSKEVVIEMAENIRQIAHSDFGIGITGIAGPGGGTKEKPVGLVYLAIASNDKTEVRKLLLGRNRINDRQRVRHLTSLHALKLLDEFVKQALN